MDTPDGQCALLAAEQFGCITAAQAAGCGLSREAVQRRVGSRRWRRVLPRTYVIGGAPATWEQRLFAAILWAGESAVASGPSAAALWGLPDFPPGPVEISHTGARQSRRGVVVRRVGLDDSDVTTVRGIPVTSPARTLADIAGTVSGSRFDAAFHHCLHHRLTTFEALDEITQRRSGSGFAGAGLLRDCVEAYAGRAAGSPLEARLALRLRAAGLPIAKRQHEVRLLDGRRYLDFAWPARRVAIEVDGYRWHSSRTSWRSDRKRLTALRRAGWTILNVTQEDVDRTFDELAAELRTLLR